MLTLDAYFGKDYQILLFKLAVLMLSGFLSVSFMFLVVNQLCCFQLQTLMNVSEAPHGARVKRKKISKLTGLPLASFPVEVSELETD